MNETPKPLSKKATKKLEYESKKVGGQPAPEQVQYGYKMEYHEGLKCGFGAILQPNPANSKTHIIYVFSFNITGITCSITSCEKKEVLLHQVDDYLQGTKRGEETEPTQDIRDCIEEYLQTLSIGIIF